MASEYVVMRSGPVELRTWRFDKDDEMDIEVWNNGEFVTTLTINLLERASC